MAGITLEELVIKFVGDVKQLQVATQKTVDSLKKIGDRANKTASRVRSAFARIGKSFTKLNKTIRTHARAFKIAGLAIIGVLGMMVKGSISYGVQIDKMMKQTGMSAQALSRMAYAAEQEHASIDILQKSLVKLSRTMQYCIISPSSEYAKAFKEMGIDPIDHMTGRLRSAEVVFAEIAEWMRKTKDSTARAAMALTLFGRAGGELIPFLQLGKEQITALYQEADALGITLSDKNARAAKKFDDTA